MAYWAAARLARARAARTAFSAAPGFEVYAATLREQRICAVGSRSHPALFPGYAFILIDSNGTPRLVRRVRWGSS